MNLRIFEDEEGKMNQSLLQKSGEMLVVSQFTLYGDARHGRRPSFTAAAPPDSANRLYEEFVQYVEKQGVRVATGVFQTEMVVSLDNHGPVTILLDSKKEFLGGERLWPYSIRPFRSARWRPIVILSMTMLKKQRF